MSVDLANKTGCQAGAWQLTSFRAARNGIAEYAATAGEKRARVELMYADSEEAGEARHRCEIARELSHPNLTQVYDCGEAEIDGVRFTFTASEIPDDNIGAILADRPLELDEAREMTKAAANALAYLHQRSLRLGDLSPSNMLIVGEAVKFGVASIGEADESGRQDDLKQLGTTLATALGDSGGPGTPLPNPFRKIVRSCLDPADAGWTPEKLLQTLDEKAIPAAAKEKITPRPAPPPQVSPSRANSITGAAEMRPPIIRQPVLAEPSGGGFNRIWIPAGVVGVALLGVFGYRSLDNSGAPHKVVESTAPVSAPAAVPPASAEISKPSPTPVRAQAPAAATPHQPKHAAASGASERDRKKLTPGGSWGVIAATYNTQEAAQKRAASMAKRLNGIEPRIFHPAGGSRYFVILGSGMNQSEAEKLRRTAVEHGAPADAYATKIQNP